ncbi:glycosyltransferase family 4 protein [Halococcus dombrowskii]|uniref:Glycosyltransferase family 4 protein n=2 Tax=Halococcus dombrowskii TaxID=179637 RepID=A0AAX3ALQ5_HALDO|nr:glycosyltransferase family 4 protein [Halococcus dombrowskii]UOO95167.1 glycosyltransferase family 4 protein [Halococcus dombrowskii]
MDIIYVLSQFPRLSESFVMNELYELDQRGHDLAVFSQLPPNEDITHTEFDDFEIPIYYANPPSIDSLPNLHSEKILNPTVLKQALFMDYPHHHAFLLNLAKQIVDAIEAEGGVDLIHSHFANHSRMAATYAAAYYNIPCTVTAHATEMFTPTSETRLQRVCSRHDHIITPSEYNKRYLRETVGTTTDISVVPATTDVDKFEPSTGSVSGRLLTVARLVEKKGHEYAIAAVGELIANGYDVEYHIVGKGSRESKLREYARMHEVEDHVRFLGHVSDERLRKELHEAEVFVLPCVIASDGDRDVAPVSLKEAMATETACVSTTVSAIPELITNGKDGVLVDHRTMDGLAGEIASLLDNSERRQQIAKSARETMVEEFDISTTVNSLVDVLETIST